MCVRGPERVCVCALGFSWLLECVRMCLQSHVICHHLCVCLNLYVCLWVYLHVCLLGPCSCVLMHDCHWNLPATATESFNPTVQDKRRNPCTLFLIKHDNQCKACTFGCWFYVQLINLLTIKL